VLVLVSVLVGLTRNFVAVRRCCAVFYVVAVMPAAPLLSSIRSARNASNKMEIVAWATHIHKHKRIWAVNLRRSPVRSPLPIVPPPPSSVSFSLTADAAAQIFAYALASAVRW